jgi:hypothetical protein
MQEIKLSKPQLAQRADTLAGLIEQIASVETDLKEVSADYKKRLKSMRLEATRLARVVKTGIEIVDSQLQLTAEEEHEDGPTA